MRWRKHHRHLTASDPNYNARSAPRSVLGSSALGFVDSSGGTSGSPIDKTTKYPSTVPIVKQASVPSETPTNYPPRVPKEFPISNPSNMLIEYPNGYPTVYPITMPTDNSSSKPRAHPSADPDFIKRGRQEAQVSLKIYLILLIIHIISPLSSRQIVTEMLQQGSQIISHIGVHTSYYDTRDLFSSTSSQIYNKEKRKRVKVYLFYKSVMDSNTFLFNPTVSKIDHS